MNEKWIEQAKLLRYLILTSTTTAGSGHPTSCLSSADIATVLFSSYFTFDVSLPEKISNDRFVLSKGHAAPLLYSLFAMSGAYPLSDLNTLRKFKSNLEGHPTSHYKFADAATGSLGQGLSVGAGMAYGLKKEFETEESLIPKVYVLLGDGEMAEGQNWEAANFASHYSLSNLVAIVDVNRLGQSQETMFGRDVKKYSERFEAFGFETVCIDGHNFDEIKAAFESAKKSSKPFAIIASTIKGKGVQLLEDAEKWHGKAIPKDKLDAALQGLGNVDQNVRFTLQSSSTSSLPHTVKSGSNAASAILDLKVGEDYATREVYGKVLSQMFSSDSSMYVLDGDVQNSTFSEDFAKLHPANFIECFIAEQNMVSVAVGLSRLKKKPFVSTFASFLTRAADQIRMAAIGKASIVFAGSHVGVSIGEDGPSQMGLEDISLFGSIPDTKIIQPADAMSMSKLLPLLSQEDGISYVRMLRPKTKLLYTDNDSFKIGGSSVLKHTQDDVLTILATGITVHEALKAAEVLEQEGINVRVIDCYSIKPLDKEGILHAVASTREKIVITVEDHFDHGGFGDFVLAAVADEDVAVHKLAVKDISRSGSMEELLADAKIDSHAIVTLVKELA